MAIDPPLQTLLDIFTAQLAALRFADFDANVLTAAADQVRTRSEAVAEAEAALSAARDQLTRAEDDLLRTGQRALAYARIYAEDHPELAQKLQEIALALGGAGNDDSNGHHSRRRKRRRSPKASSEQEMALPLSQPEGAVGSTDPSQLS